MACHLFTAKPLSEPLLSIVFLDQWAHISIKFVSKYNKFHSKKWFWKCHLQHIKTFCLNLSVLIHWGRVTHICVSKLTIIGLDNGLSPGRRQAIIWTNAGILLIQTSGTNFSEIIGEIHSFSFSKMYLNMSSAKWRLFGLGLNELSERWSLCRGSTVLLGGVLVFLWIYEWFVWNSVWAYVLFFVVISCFIFPASWFWRCLPCIFVLFLQLSLWCCFQSMLSKYFHHQYLNQGPVSIQRPSW